MTAAQPSPETGPEVAQREAPQLGCGSCNLCCKLLEIKDMGKPAGMLCWNTGIHGGCTVHKEKATDPQLRACFQFKCVWLESQMLDDPIKRGSRGMRPDQTHVLFGPFDRDDPLLLYVHVDPAHKNAWLSHDVLAYMNEVKSKGGRLVVVIGDHHFEYQPDESILSVNVPNSTVGLTQGPPMAKLDVESGD